MEKVANRYNGEVGIERVNRDGKIEILKPSDVEVTPTDRMRWYNRASLDPRGNEIDKIYDVEKDDGGNPLQLENLKERTREPRPHQYSTERRLEEMRNPNSTESIHSDASLSEAMAMTFYEVVKEIDSGKSFDNNQVIRISNTTESSIEDVVRLKSIAEKRPDLVTAFRSLDMTKTADSIPGKSDGKGQCKNCKDSVPGVTSPIDDESAIITKESDPCGELGEEDLKSVGLEVALVDEEEMGVADNAMHTR